MKGGQIELSLSANSSEVTLFYENWKLDSKMVADLGMWSLFKM